MLWGINTFYSTWIGRIILNRRITVASTSRGSSTISNHARFSRTPSFHSTWIGKNAMGYYIPYHLHRKNYCWIGRITVASTSRGSSAISNHARFPRTSAFHSTWIRKNTKWIIFHSNWIGIITIEKEELLWQAPRGASARNQTTRARPSTFHSTWIGKKSMVNYIP